MHSRFIRKPDGSYVAEATKRGRDAVRDPLINKGSAFTDEERAALRLEGLLPAGVVDIATQVERVVEALARLDDPLVRYVELADLQDRNETLFLRILVDRIEELMPIVYTPTVGDASRLFSHIFRRGRGRWISPKHRGRISEVLGQIKADIRLIVVTDNERILGLGDQGAGGMVIPIGKLALYSAAAGIHPTQTLPISLDVGTDNEALLEDPAYLGWREPRLRGKPYYDLVEEFVHAVRDNFPKALLQWEDFKKGTAFRLLDRYRQILPSFNDDIQGTAAVALAGVLAAGRACGRDLSEERVVILGAGAAGIGIAHQLRAAKREAGLSDDDLTAAVAVLDSRGLLLAEDDSLDEYKRDFAWPARILERFGLAAAPRPDLAAVVAAVKPTVLIGTAGFPGLFTEEIVREMARHVERPAIFPFSNPTSQIEAVPEDILRWTEGRAFIATGSPFDPVEVDGRQMVISQGNNVYIFPGLGLGAMAVEARQVTDSMVTAAATRLARLVDEADLARGELYPPVAQLREVARLLAIAVAETAVHEGVALEPRGGVRAAVDAWMWDPQYPELRAV